MSDRKNIHKLQSAMSNLLDITDTLISIIKKYELSFGEHELIEECKQVMKRTKEQWYPVESGPEGE